MFQLEQIRKSRHKVTSANEDALCGYSNRILSCCRAGKTVVKNFQYGLTLARIFADTFDAKISPHHPIVNAHAGLFCAAPNSLHDACQRSNPQCMFGHHGAHRETYCHRWFQNSTSLRAWISLERESLWSYLRFDSTWASCNASSFSLRNVSFNCFISAILSLLSCLFFTCKKMPNVAVVFFHESSGFGLGV